MHQSVQRRLFRLGLLLLALFAAAILLNGVVYAWAGGDKDMSQRLKEYGVLLEGVFPHRLLASRQAMPGFRSTVYPPYALPMFAAFFAWGGAIQGRVTIQVMSFASLALIGWCGHRILRWAGPEAGMLGALARVAISGNSNALSLGQFSIPCMGLITLQLLLLQRKRPLPAGLCWALAMIKPQIALPFALPFLARKRLAGLLLGAALLLGLSFAALQITGVSPKAYLGIWSDRQSLGFVKEGSTTLIGLLTGRLGLSAFWIQVFLTGVLGLLILGWWLWRGGLAADPLQVVAVCSVIAFIAFYHRNYDNILLAPALLATLDHTFRSHFRLAHSRRVWVVLSVLLAMSLWMP
jgi:hypothetical protein